MISRFLQVSSLGLIVAGCSSVLSGARPPDPSEEGTTEALPTKISFGQDSRVFKAYEMLRAHQVGRQQMDRGCHTINFALRKPNRTLHYRQDQKVQECEVIEYALDHYQQYPELAREIIGGPIPWTFEEEYRDESFRKSILQQASDAINALREGLEKQRFKADSDAYKESLAVGLYYFALYPRRGREMKPILRDILRGHATQLGYGGLDVFRQWVEKRGGLGLSQFSAIDAAELSALEALQQEKGECTEKSKILYALLKMAGLDPVFVYGRYKDLEGKLTRHDRQIPFKSRFEDHVYLGLQFEDHMRFLDPSIMLLTVDDNTYYSLPLVHYLAVDKNNQAIAAHYRDDDARQDDLFDQTIALSPDLPLSRLRQVIRLSQAGHHKAALSGIERLIKDYPDDARFLHLKADILMKSERAAESQAYFHRALEADPFMPQTNFSLGKLYVANAEFEKAEKYFMTTVRLDANHTDAYFFLGYTAYQLGKDRLAQEIFEKLVEHVPDYKQVLMAEAYLLIIYARNGRIGHAQERLRSIDAVKRDDSMMIYAAGVINLLDHNPHLAEQYFRKALRKNVSLATGFGLAISLWLQGSKDEAEQLFKQMSVSRQFWSGFREIELILSTHPQLPLMTKKIEQILGQKRPRL